MSVPIRTRIIASVVAALEAATEANGYLVTPLAVYRAVQDYGSQPCPFYEVLTETDEKYDELSNSSLRKVLPITVIGNVECAPGSGEGISVELEKMLADAEKALRVDRTRGGLAIDTRFLSVGLVDAEAGFPYGEFHLHLEVEYRTRAGDPFTAV